MNDEWTPGTLADIAEVVGRGITPKYADSGSAIVVNQKCVRNNRLDFARARRHDTGTKPVKQEKLLLCGDVLVNSTGVGTLGRTAPVVELAAPTTADSHLTIVRPLPSTDAAWLGYLLAANEANIERMAEGSTGQTELSRVRLASLAVDIPPPPVQKAISAVLLSIDDKIDCNTRALRLIAELSRTCFQAALDEGGFHFAPVAEVATFHNRRRVPLSSRERDRRPGPFPYYGATGVFGFIDDYLFDEVLVLVGEDGSVVEDDGSPVLQYIWGKAWINNHAHPLSGKGLSNELLYLALSASDVRPLVTGAVQAKISMTNLKALKVPIPAESVRETLEVRLSNLFSVYRQKADEIVRLKELRTTILPELISGRVHAPIHQLADAESVS
ncbi:restriction endonuclease subunit S [Actinomycetospora sp. C-140]